MQFNSTTHSEGLCRMPPIVSFGVLRVSYRPSCRVHRRVLDRSLRGHYFSFFRREARWRRPSAVM
jgi:hypothetical protein